MNRFERPERYFRPLVFCVSNERHCFYTDVEDHDFVSARGTFAGPLRFVKHFGKELYLASVYGDDYILAKSWILG